jgi:NAD(P)-dependent dehydrogenase (short-subunit alcohol dehydrogenase family)
LATARAESPCAAKKKPSIGTTFSFTLNTPAEVTLAFTQSAPGRKVGSRFVAPTNKLHKKRGCTRTIMAGSLTFAGHTGPNTVRFEGRLTPAKKLNLGRAGTAEEAAQLILFPVSPAASYITGTQFTVDGGAFPTV